MQSMQSLSVILSVKAFCGILSLRAGCFIGAIIYLAAFVYEIITNFGMFGGVADDKQALVALQIILRLLCSILIFFGGILFDRLCLILYMVFAITATVGEFFLELIYFGVHGVTSQGVTLAVRIVLEVLFHVTEAYLLVVVYQFSVHVSRQHASLMQRLSSLQSVRNRQELSSVMSYDIYGA